MAKKNINIDDIDDMLDDIRWSIKKCENKVELFMKVKKHIKEGRCTPATGEVFQYSPYMEIAECENIIELNNKAIESYRRLFGELIILKDSTQLNNSVMNLVDFDFDKSLTYIIEEAIHKNSDLIDRYDNTTKEKTQIDEKRKKIDSLIAKYTGGE